MARKFIYRRSTWRGKFVDLWTLPHVISGFITAYGVVFFNIDFWTGFWLALALGVVWEIMERITRFSRTEAYTNSLGDIVMAQAGHVAGWFLFRQITDPYAGMLVMLALCAVFAFVCLLGFRAFKYYG